MEDKILKALEELKNDNIKFGKRFDNIDKKFDKIDKRFDKLEVRMDKIENKMGNLESEIKINKAQTKENTNILKALMHSAEVNKSSHDKMELDIANLQGDVTALRKDMSTMEVVTANNYADIARLKAVK